MSATDGLPGSLEIRQPDPIAQPAAVALFGSGPFAIPILDALAAMPEARLVGVVSVPDRAAGRGARMTAAPLADVARERGLLLLQPSRLRDPAAIAAIADLRAEVAVLADYGRLVPRELLEVPPRGFLNLHPSLLPRHRGATPVQATILAGDEEAGVTLFEMDPGLDTGPIVGHVAWPLTGAETAPELEAESARRAARLLSSEFGPWLAGERPSHAQPGADASLTRPLTREDGRLDPDRSAQELERQVRAFMPWPGTFLDTSAGRIAVLRAEIAPSEPGDAPGALAPDRAGLALTTSQGRLRLLEVKPAGGVAMAASDLRRGRPALAGARVLERVVA
jgi:methionyl-tRNA formyltransferase